MDGLVLGATLLKERLQKTKQSPFYHKVSLYSTIQEGKTRVQPMGYDELEFFSNFEKAAGLGAEEESDDSVSCDEGDHRNAVTSTERRRLMERLKESKTLPNLQVEEIRLPEVTEKKTQVVRGDTSVEKKKGLQLVLKQGTGLETPRELRREKSVIKTVDTLSSVPLSCVDTTLCFDAVRLAEVLL